MCWFADWVTLLSARCKYKITATCFDLASHLQTYLRTIKLITICLCTFWIPDGSQRVLGLAYNVIPMYCCIYVYIGGDVCAASWGRCSCGPGYVRRGFFIFSLFSFGCMGLGGGPPVVLFLSLLLLASCFCSVSSNIYTLSCYKIHKHFDKYLRKIFRERAAVPYCEGYFLRKTKRHKITLTFWCRNYFFF